MFKKILMPVDGTGKSEDVVAYVKSIADKFDSEIVIFNSQSPNQGITWLSDPTVFAQQLFDPEDIAKKIVEERAKDFDASKYKISTKVSIGDAAFTILDVCKELECDVIIIGTHGMDVAKRFLLGSVTNKVVHHAEIPVLVIR